MTKGSIIIDCGAGSVRAVAVDESGQVAGICSEPNGAVVDSWVTGQLGDWGDGGLVWDAEGIFSKAIRVVRKLISGLSDFEPVAITVTSFGVDGTFVDSEGALLYPVISWQCSRSADVASRIAEFMDPGELRRINGLHPFHFNTLFKLLWFREHHPQIIEKAHAFLFMPSILIHRLCGAMVTDMTLAGTSMLTSLEERAFSENILGMAGLDARLFPSPVEAGTVAGLLGDWVAGEMGLPAGIPVVVAGHDTQFALFASALSPDQPILSSGTWEILSVRTSSLTKGKESELSIEFDAMPGLYNPLTMWVASGVVEWVARTFYPTLQDNPEKYSILINEASAIPAGCDGLSFIPDILDGGSSRKGEFKGITQSMRPAHFVRATFEALAYKLASGVNTLENACGFKAASLVISGGGSKNRLWNQIRADVLGIPLLVSERCEATSLGAAMFAMAAAGVFSSADEALKSWKLPYTTVEPGPLKEVYQKLFYEHQKGLHPVQKPSSPCSPSAIVADAMRRVYDGGLTTPSGGNISLKDSHGNVWVTPTLLDKGSLQEDDIVCIADNGSISGRQKPTSEYPFHLAIYESRPGVKAIVHNHSPALVACSLTGLIPDKSLLPLLTGDIGDVVIAPYAIPGSGDLASVVSSAFSGGANAVLMANHGIITVGKDMPEALLRMVSLELLAQAMVTASSLAPLSAPGLKQDFNELVAGLPALLSVSADEVSDSVHASSSELQNYWERAIRRKLNPWGFGSWSERSGNSSFQFIYSERGIITGASASQLIDPASAAMHTSWEYQLHKAIYSQHPEINSMAIAFPPALLAYSLISKEFNARTIPESYIFLREALTLDLGSFLSDPQSLVKAINPSSPVALVQNGFFLCTGTSPFNVLDRLEVAENTAASLLNATVLGTVNPMDDAVIRDLKEKYLS
jgi:L-fuculokinase